MGSPIRRFLPLAVAITLTAGVAAEGAAQQSPTNGAGTRVTSTRRIPVQKEGTVTESAGQILADSIERARQDSIAAAERARQEEMAAAERARQEEMAAAERARVAAEQARRDSIAAAERARQDAIAAAERAKAERFRRGRFNGWYFNLGGGAAVPTGDLENMYGTGINATGSVGWHRTESVIGIRFDATYDQLNGEDPVGFVPELDDASMVAGLAEVTLRIPRALKLNPYIIGGGGVYRFSDYGVTNESSTEWGWNAGAGVRFGWGFTSLFVEARYTSVSTPGDGDRAEYVPVLLGITFR